MEWVFEIDWDRDGTYTAENTRLLELRTNRGRARMMNSGGLEPMRAGEVHAVVDNYDGRYDPYNTAGALYGYLKPGRPIRVKATEGGATRAVFTGYVSDVRPQAGRDSRAVIKAVDGLTFLERQECDTAATQTNYAVSDAISDLLTQADWPLVSSVTTFPFTWPLVTGSTAIPDNGDAIASFAPDPTTTIRDTLDEIAEAFLGAVYINTTGSLAYIPRGAARPTVLTLTQGLLSPEIEETAPWDEIYNDITVTPTVGAASVLSDTASQDDYFRQTMSIRDNPFIQSEAQATNLIGVLGLYAPELKRGLRVRLQDRFDEQFGADLAQRVRVTIAAKGIDAYYQIGQIEHDWRSGMACTTTYRLEPDFYEVAGLQTFPFTWPLTLGWGGGT